MPNRKDTFFSDNLSDDISGATREVSSYIKPAVKGQRQEGEVCMTRTCKDGKHDTYILPNLTREDARILVEAIRHTFDLVSEEQIAKDLLDAKMQNMDQIAENMAHVAIANLMLENGLRRAVLTPSRIATGMVPPYSIEVDKDQLTYTLGVDPLNESTDTHPNGISG